MPVLFDPDVEIKEIPGGVREPDPPPSRKRAVDIPSPVIRPTSVQVRVDGGQKLSHPLLPKARDIVSLPTPSPTGQNENLRG